MECRHKGIKGSPHGVTYQTAENTEFYSEVSSEVDAAGHFDVKKWMENVIDGIPLKESECFTFCDYGCADGGGSLSLVKELIDRVRDLHGKEREVLIIYEDQPETNLSTVFEKREERLATSPGVHFLACGRSFYHQCLPDNSVNLGICVHAVHWLSYKPCQLSDALVVDDGTEEERAQYSKVAAEDWTNFLLGRAAELRSGGFLRIVSAAHQDGERFTMSPLTASNPKEGKLILPLLETVRRNMLQEDLVTADEAKSMCWPLYTRDEEDFAAPFQSSESMVYQKGLRLVSFERRNYDCGLYVKYIKATKETEESNSAFARALTVSFKAFLHTTIFGALSEDRPHEERRSIADLYFERFENEILKDPRQYGFGLCTVHMTVRKV